MMGSVEETQQPLLGSNKEEIPEIPPIPKAGKTAAQKAIRKTFKGTAQLSNLLPTGTVLIFQMLSPGLTRQGKCPTVLNQSMTVGLLVFCSLSCFVLCFTDSLRDERGKVRYGLATFKGLWVIDGTKLEIGPDQAAKYRLSFIDLLHALMSIMVFAAVALFDQNVVSCFVPNPSVETKQLLVGLPVGIAVLCSFFFLLFPTRRHGIGFPLSRS